MDIANSPEFARRLTPKLIPQHRINAHLRSPSNLSRKLKRFFKHNLRRRNLIHDPILECLLARPSMRFQQHLACDLRRKLQPRKRADAVEVEAKIYWWHAYEASLGVHDAIVVGQGIWTSSAESVASD